MQQQQMPGGGNRNKFGESLDDSENARYNSIHMIEFLREYQVVIIPLLVMSISQLIKVVLDTHREGFAWKHIKSYGGMPSSHTALFISLALTIGLVNGFADPLFAVAAFVGAAFIRDAVGIRWSLGFHGKILNHLISTLSTKDKKSFPGKLEERLGHTPVEALFGGVIGILATLLLHSLLQM